MRSTTGVGSDAAARSTTMAFPWRFSSIRSSTFLRYSSW